MLFRKSQKRLFANFGASVQEQSAFLNIGEQPCSVQRVQMKLKVELTKLPSGKYVAYVPGLPGCAAEADTEEGVIVEIRQAIAIYLQCLNDDPGARTLNTQLIEVDV